MTAALRLSPNLRDRLCRTVFAVTPFVLLLSGFQFELSAILAMDQGRFIYSLDDPYIHLALAQHIAQGHYGINLSEISAPSSSILWPFLLAPFARTTFYEYVPLALNLLAAAGTLFVYTKIVRTALREAPDFYARAAAAWIAIFLIPATNLIGLAFTGMEHSLQVFLCAAIVLGLIQVVRGRDGKPSANCEQSDGAAGRDGPTPRWLVAALIAAPAVRYECLAVALPALLVLLACRRWKAAAFSLVGMLIPLAAFSLFLHANGLGWLPTSVIAKVSTANGRPTPNFITDHLIYNLGLRQGQVLGCLFLLLAWLAIARAGTPRTERILAIAGAAAILAHLSAGQIGWWDRYEIYMVVTAVLLVIFLGRGFFQRLFWSAWNQRGWRSYLWPPLNLALLGGLAWLVGMPYFGNFARTSMASANIYEQQYQMNRFVTGYLRAPVAVNDLGWASFGSPDYVLDLWGLASPEALADRTTQAGSDWMDRLVRQHGVRLVMIYDTWFRWRPRSWAPVARLHLGWKQTSAGSDTVTFYVPDAGDVAAIRALLEQFKPTLPPGVRLEIID